MLGDRAEGQNPDARAKGQSWNQRTGAGISNIAGPRDKSDKQGSGVE